MYEQLQQLLLDSSYTLAFTGAGISTLSGIRDFRGSDGIYRSTWNGMEVESILSTEVFASDPSIFYRWAREFVYNLDKFKPSIVHMTLALLEEKGYLAGVYTQNIDLLHQKAGSKHVWELHGSPAHHSCPRCQKTYTYEQVAPQVQSGAVPLCADCFIPMRPGIVLYGDPLDGKLLDQAYMDMSKAQLLLVLGSSLTVQPAASLPMATFYRGGKLVIINAQDTPLDRHAKIRLNDLGSTFEHLYHWAMALPPRITK